MGSEILKIVRADPSLFLGIRNNYVNIYYLGASLTKISNKKNGLRFSTSVKYLPYCTRGLKNYDISYTEEKLIDNIREIKRNIYNYQYQGSTRKNVKREKIAQQKLMQKNNLNPASKWFCVDMEYGLQRKHNKEPNFGRFDIVAISKTKPHRIALIELKYGSEAYSGDYKQLKIAMSNEKYQNDKEYILTTNHNFGSGILGHVCDYIRFMESGKISILKEGIIESCNNYSELDLLPENLDLKDISIKDFSEKPEVYFITLGEDIKKAKTQIKKYLVSKNKNKGASKYNFEDILGVDITKSNSLFNLQYLFWIKSV